MIAPILKANDNFWTGAGVLPYIELDGKVYFLIASEKTKKNAWGEFGGGRDVEKHPNPIYNAACEFWEEMCSCNSNLLGSIDEIYKWLLWHYHTILRYDDSYTVIAKVPAEWTNKLLLRFYTAKNKDKPRHCLEKNKLGLISEKSLVSAVLHRKGLIPAIHVVDKSDGSRKLVKNTEIAHRGMVNRLGLLVKANKKSILKHVPNNLFYTQSK